MAQKITKPVADVEEELTSEQLDQNKRAYFLKRFSKKFLKFIVVGYVDWCRRNKIAIAVVATWCAIITVFIIELLLSTNYATDYWIIKLLGPHLSTLYSCYDLMWKYPLAALGATLVATFLLGSICVMLRQLRFKLAVVLRHIFRVLCCLPVLACVVIGVVGIAIDGTIEDPQAIQYFEQRADYYGALSNQKIPSFRELIHKITTDPDFYENRPIAERLKTNQQVIDYIALQSGPLTKEQHLLRNHLNIAPPTLGDMLSGRKVISQRWILLTPFASAYHMFGPGGEYNVKFISEDGRFEAVYNKHGELLTDENDPVNMGTYNYAGNDAPGWGHSNWDVVPYFVWGNGGTPPLFSSQDVIHNLERFFRNKDAQRRYEQIRLKAR